MDEQTVEALERRISELRQGVAEEERRLRGRRLRNAALDMGVSEDKLAYLERLIEPAEEETAESLRISLEKLLTELPFLADTGERFPANPADALMDTREARYRNARERGDIKTIIAMKLGTRA